jgi:hypothetical protein
MKKIKHLIKNVLFLLNVILHFNKEPYFNMRLLLKHIFEHQLFSIRNSELLSSKVLTKETDHGHFFRYQNVQLYYPNSIPVKRALANFSCVIAEQAINHPHRHNFQLIQKHWNVWDVGTAEGYQVFSYLDKADKVVLFEPDDAFCNSLRHTFSEEIAAGKVLLLNIAVGSDNEKSSTSIVSLIDAYNLPLPDYLKADIEGNEMAFLRSLTPLLEQKVIKVIEITTYHRPNDAVQIKEYLMKFGGNGFYSDGNIFLNIDGWEKQGSFKKLYQPVMRKVLYTHQY